MDANENVRIGNIKKLLDKTDMSDVVMSTHGSDAPNTHIDGSKPIEGIFATRAVKCVQSGYTAFGDESKANARITDASGWMYGCKRSSGTACPQSRKPPSAR